MCDNSMKRRRLFVASCDYCHLNFESENSHAQHQTTRGHMQKILARRNFETEQRMEIREPDDEISDDNGNILSTQEDESCSVTTNSDADIAVDEEFLPQLSSQEDAIGEYFPFPSEMFFLLYCYTHSVMKPKSRADLQFLWMMLKRFGVNPPPLQSILDFKIIGLEDKLPLHKDYGNGHPFYWIAPSDLVKLQLATPATATLLARYPQQTERIIEEIFQGEKWNISKEFQTSSITVNDKTYYVKDIVEYKQSDNETPYYGQLNKFYSKKLGNSLLTMCEIQEMKPHNTDNKVLVISERCLNICTELISGTTNKNILYKENNHGNVIPLTNEEISTVVSPHPSKAIAAGKPTLTLPMVVFSDETSGNRTKKWNKLETYSMFLASLPRKEATKFSNLNFICVSNLVDSITLGKAITNDLKALQDGIPMFDAYLKKEVFVQSPVIIVSCDNPRASEFTNHLGSSANHFCRKCNATKETATEIGIRRTDEETRDIIVQINNARNQNQKTIKKRETGITEKGGQFNELSCFNAVECPRKMKNIYVECQSRGDILSENEKILSEELCCVKKQI